MVDSLYASGRERIMIICAFAAQITDKSYLLSAV